MDAYFLDGALENDKAIGRVTAVYRNGRSLFDPAIGASIEINLRDHIDNYLGTIKMVLSLAESASLSEQLTAIVERSKTAKPTHERYT